MVFTYFMHCKTFSPKEFGFSRVVFQISISIYTSNLISIFFHFANPHVSSS